jgi:stage V sporulation protein R
MPRVAQSLASGCAFSIISRTGGQGAHVFSVSALADATAARSVFVESGNARHIFRVRENYCDYMFLKDFLDQDFVDLH